jgi:carbamoyltransferase
MPVLGYRIFDEYKAMGLAPYGDPAVFEKLFTSQYRLLPEGRFSLTTQQEMYGLMIKAGLADRARRKGEPFTQVNKDFVAALQVALERIVTHVVMHFQRLTKARNLCLSGGVAHNCSMNGRLLQTQVFESIYVAPASNDAGNALGAALSVLHDTAPLTHSSEIFPHVFFGTDIGDRDSNNDNEPIVDSIDDAIACFLTTDIQYLFIGDWMVRKPASIRERSGLVDLVPTIPKSYRLVRRAEPKGTETRFSLRHLADACSTATAGRNAALMRRKGSSTGTVRLL